MSDAVLAIENLSVALPSWADRPHAVDGVSLEVLRKEILCVVGESGLRQVGDGQVHPAPAARAARARDAVAASCTRARTS